MITDKLSNTLNGLLDRLHGAMVAFVKGLEGVVDRNESVELSDINRLREQVKSRLEKGEDTADNQKLLKLIDLFATDKAVIKLMKSEIQDWIGLIEAIEKHLDEKGETLTGDEKKEIEKMKVILSEVKEVIREDKR